MFGAFWVYFGTPETFKRGSSFGPPLEPQKRGPDLGHALGKTLKSILENPQNALGKCQNALGKCPKCSWKILKWGSNFGPQLGAPKPPPHKVQMSPMLDPFLDETCLEIPLGPARSRSRALFFGSEGLQERSKSHSRGLRQPSRSRAAI